MKSRKFEIKCLKCGSTNVKKVSTSYDDDDYDYDSDDNTIYWETILEYNDCGEKEIW